MIVSRAAELGRLDELIARLRAGDGRALVVHGDPGIGKTTLLDALVARCDDDMTVLRARGVETEAELAFAALSDFLAPIIDDARALPAPQSAALAAALALGPPAPGDRLAICVATLGLLRTKAGSGPVIAVVDDVHWLDAASRECILYAARRTGGSLAVALAIRDPWDAALERAGLPALLLSPLDADASLELLERVAPDLTPSVAGAIVEAAAGNPLALVELSASLTADQRAGVAEVELPLAPGSRLHGAFAAKIDELDPQARRALLVAATHVGDDLTAITAACLAAGTDVRRLAQAEERGLVRLGNGQIAFAHPTIRGAAYHAAGPAERRRAHGALAAVLQGERRAWHLAAAVVGTDERVAVELERVAGGAAARRGFASAYAALERAARLSPEPEAAAGRLLAGGQAASAAGARERALALLQEASSMARDPGLRARAEHLRGRMMVWSGRPAEATRALVAEAERAVGHDRALAAAMLADAANGCTVTNAYHRAEALAHRAVALLGDEGDPLARAPVLAMLGWVLVLRGKAPRARPALSEAERLAEELDPLGPHWPWRHLLLLARIPLGDLERARAESAALCERARDAGALATLGGTLIVAADVALRLGDWDAADAAALEAIRVAGDTGQHAWHGYALSIRTRLAGARGLEKEGRSAARSALAIAESEGMRSGLRFVHGAHGFLELSVDHVDEAIAKLEAVDRIVEGSGLEDPTLVPWAPDLVEAHVRSGNVKDARRVLAMLERQAASSGTAVAGAVAARCRGMLDEDFDAPFAESLALDDRRPLPFERARTLLALGRRLHRVRRRAEARERLREALAGFDRLGAAAWARQAQNELRAAGARRRSTRGDVLTPQELRVARAVRRGASNREIAAELFLAPKTIEFHLHQIYRKLGIRSRTQLVATLAGEPVSRQEADR
jgi:DNA-binding CsgD family transcriptional regulator